MPPQLGLSQRRRVLRLERPDLIFVQKCYHSLNRVEYLDGRPFVFDMDDADFLDSRFTDVIRSLCEQAIGVTVANLFVRQWCARFARRCELTVGGYDSLHRPSTSAGNRRPSLVWAHAAPYSAPADAQLLEQILDKLAEAGLRFSLALGGWSVRNSIAEPRRSANQLFLDGFVDRVRQRGIECSTRPLLTPSTLHKFLSECAVALQPLVRGPTPDYNWGKAGGKLAAYAAAGCAIVATDVPEHSLILRSGEEILVGSSVEQLAEQIAMLFADRERRSQIGDAARGAIEGRLSSEGLASQYDSTFRKWLASSP